MNIKAQANLLFILMIGIICFVLGLALANPLKEVVTEQMDSTFLNCTTTTDQQTKAVCTSLDMLTPLFCGTIFGLVGILLSAIARM